jgi:hypothetical protein
MTRFYDLFFWCTWGHHYVSKETAVLDSRGGFLCPRHRRKLRLKSHADAESRDRLYPRSRVA